VEVDPDHPEQGESAQDVEGMETIGVAGHCREIIEN